MWKHTISNKPHIYRSLHSFAAQQRPFLLKVKAILLRSLIFYWALGSGYWNGPYFYLAIVRGSIFLIMLVLLHLSRLITCFRLRGSKPGLWLERGGFRGLTLLQDILVQDFHHASGTKASNCSWIEPLGNSNKTNWKIKSLDSLVIGKSGHIWTTASAQAPCALRPSRAEHDRGSSGEEPCVVQCIRAWLLCRPLSSFHQISRIEISPVISDCVLCMYSGGRTHLHSCRIAFKYAERGERGLIWRWHCLLPQRGGRLTGALIRLAEISLPLQQGNLSLPFICRTGHHPVDAQLSRYSWRSEDSGQITRV